MARPIVSIIIAMAFVVLFWVGAFFLAIHIGESLSNWADKMTCALVQNHTEAQIKFCDKVFEDALNG